METAIIAAGLYIVFIFIVLAVLRKMNGPDTDADAAADSVRQSLDADSRFDELHSYTHPRVKAITEVRK